MLILPKSLQLETKNPLWTLQTPNEAYRNPLDTRYHDLVEQWSRDNQIPGPFAFQQVRVVNQQSALSIRRSSCWWDKALFMDKVFWVYRQPETFYPEGRDPYQAYFLEYYECMRVADAAINELGQSPFPPEASLMIPCDCCTHAWDETSGGYSDHIEYRPEPTDAEKDREANLMGEAEEVIKNLIPLDPLGD